MASPHHLHLLLLILLLPKPYTSARTINTNSTSHHNKLRGGAFLVHPLWAGTLISFSAGFSLGTIAFLIWRLYKSHCAEPEAAVELSSSKPTLFSPIIRSIDDLSFLQTLHHAGHPLTLEVIGRGGCGEVYKAEIFTGDRLIPIAIKKVVQPSADAAHLCEEESKLLSHRMRQVRAEIVTVGRMRHPNLLRLLAHVPRPDCHYLVYEFMKEGSLHDVLRREPRKLGWPGRLRIAVGIAAGLEYLHTVHRPRVIHRDLKPANVLLDSDMSARISDFGLAKVLTIETMSRTTMSSKVAGTVGYIAPEYYQTMACTDKCDVYSFGVILAVLVTGRFPNDRFFETTEEPCLMGWVRSVMSSEEPNAIIDPMLVGDGFETEMLLVLKIACFCTYEDPKERPSSRDVRCMLAQIGN